MTVSTLRVAFYARVSSDHQADQGTIASQLVALRQRIAADGGRVEPELEFCDDGYSGATLLRPALERLRDQAAQGTIDRLYVLAPDRLARKYALQCLLLEELQRAGLTVVFLNHAHGKSPEDDLLLQVQGVIAEYERAKISERGRRGKLHAAKSGQVSVFSAAPYGYRYVGKQQGGGQARYEIVWEQARIVQKIFAWVGRERLSICEVCRRLERLGEPSPSGRARWPRATVGVLLRNPAYQGQAAYGKTRVRPRQPSLRPRRGKPEVPRRPYSVTRQNTQPLLVPVPALVSEDDFAAVGEQLTENQKRHRQRRAGARYLLQGLLVCAGCGYAWHGLTRKSGGQPRCSYYRCSGPRTGDPQTPCRVRQLRAATLEDAVWNDVRGLLAHPHKIEEEYQQRLHNKPGQAEQRGIEPVKRVIDKVKRSINRLIDLYSEGLMDKSELEPRLTSAKARLAKLEAEAQTLAAEAAQQAELRLALTRLQDFAAQVEEGLEHADGATRREVIRALVKRIEVSDREIRVVYRVAPVPFVESPHGGVLQHCPRRRVRLCRKPPENLTPT
jgi:site-specific DNA recombinase